MNVWEVDNRITAIIAEQCELADDSTGEITDINRLLELEMEKTELLEQLALEYKNRKAEAEAIKQEEANLKARRAIAEKACSRIAEYIDCIAEGEPLKTPKCAITFRHSKSVAFDDVEKWLAWAEVAHPELLKQADPQPNKVAISGLLKAGVEVGGAYLQDNVSMTIK